MRNITIQYNSEPIEVHYEVIKAPQMLNEYAGIKSGIKVSMVLYNSNEVTDLLDHSKIKDAIIKKLKTKN